MIKSVVREHHWPPNIIKNLYLDKEDYQGLEYWYDDVKEVNDNLKKK
ncbi:hypothetical protein LCGC14_0536740 [marine sediment metagenome]|uniref:Uncharacterized protein n=1 Tax=marine sediment metagenome TaxID=412755 RepID=A0A0F9RYL2_9ZZZZ